jgi:hypothetical protein
MAKIPVVVILSAAALSFAACRSTTPKNNQPVKTMEAAKAYRFACLPDDVKPSQVVSYGKRNVTVEEKLDAMKAACENGKLVDAQKREIRFYRIACFGNPPYNYNEIRMREQEEIAKLSETCTVIVLECNPMIM